MTTTYPTTITARPGLPFLEIVREFDATPDQVYRAMSEPDLVQQWLGPRELVMEVDHFDVRSGGSYRYKHTDAEGNAYWFRGVIHTAIPGELVIQTFEYEDFPGQVSLETARIEAVDGRTRISASSVFPSVEARDGAIASGMERGIRDSYDRLGELLERGV